MKADVLIVGGGTGGTAAAIALAGEGLDVVLTEPTAWLGGQLTAQCVPPDEHPWIEQFGRTRRYAEYRSRVRHTAREALPLTPEAAADPFLNPGGGWVSPLCHPPGLGVAAIADMMAGSGVEVRHGWTPAVADVQGDWVESVGFLDPEGRSHSVEARYVLDATELGDVLPLAGAEYSIGADDAAQTGEPSATGPDPEDVQALTWCAVVGHDEGGDHTIERPREYDKWREYAPSHWPGPLLSLTYRNLASNQPLTFPVFGEGLTWFGYRQIVDPRVHAGPVEPATVLNWPQNDYMEGRVVDVGPDVANARLESARQLTLSLVYWLQTEAGLPGIRLRPDLAGTPDGLAMAPYHREGRRMDALVQVREQDVAAHCHPGAVVAPRREDSVGVGAYRIDLHPGASGSPGLDISSLPFQIPIGMLVPRRLRNLLAAGKCAGTTHITNGCYRLHPVEWNLGESAGSLASFCLRQHTGPHEVAEDPAKLAEFQSELVARGVELDWPRLRPL